MAAIASTPPAQPGTTGRSGGRALVAALRAHKVDRVFCVPGESYLEVLDALYDVPEIELVVAKHEGGAANMAEADGKLTGRPGICMVTRGPGATHASVGVHIAQQDSTPLILFVGQIARGDKGRDVFQEVDYVAMFGSMAKWVVEIDRADRVPEIVARAFHVAMSGRPGPVVVALPEDMLTEPCAMPDNPATPLRPPAMGAESLEGIVSMLRQAQRPLVMVGGPNWQDGDRANLQAFAQAWKLPVACSFRRQDIFDNRHPCYAGHLGLGINPKLAARVREADVILALGTRLGDIMTDGFTLLSAPRPAQTLIHVHPDAAELGRVYQPAMTVQAGVGAAVAALAGQQAPSEPAWAARTEAAHAEHEAFSTPAEPAAGSRGVDMGAVIRHLSMTLPDDAALTNGAGNYAVWLHRYYDYRAGRNQLATTCGAMGYGLPAAVAASLRDRSRTVVCLAGDGCFLMYPQELATAAEYGASLIVLVVNNGMYGTIRMHQERHHPGRVSGTRIAGPDYVALAKSFGAHAELVSRTEDFADALNRARHHGGLALLELRTDPKQITPTMRLPD